MIRAHVSTSSRTTSKVTCRPTRWIAGLHQIDIWLSLLIWMLNSSSCQSRGYARLWCSRSLEFNLRWSLIERNIGTTSLPWTYYQARCSVWIRHWFLVLRLSIAWKFRTFWSKLIISNLSRLLASGRQFLSIRMLTTRLSSFFRHCNWAISWPFTSPIQDRNRTL